MRLFQSIIPASVLMALLTACGGGESNVESGNRDGFLPVSYTHLRAHET